MASTATQIIAALNPAMVSDPALTVHLELATNRTNVGFFGANAQMAIALRALHQYSLAQRSQGAGGAITGLTEGRVTMSFAAGKGNPKDMDLEQTNWGRQLKDLIRSQGPAASVVGATPSPGSQPLQVVGPENIPPEEW